MEFYKEMTFKNTEIGRIPKDWKSISLGEVVEINQESKDPMKEMPDDYFLYIDIESIEGGTGKIKNVKKILGREAPSRAHRVIHKSDVIMSTVRPYLRAFSLVPKEYEGQICSTGFAVLSSTSKVTPYYILSVLFSEKTIDQCNKMMIGGQYPALNQSQVSKIIIPLPPILEQQNIASILSKVDEAILQTDRIIRRTQELKKGLMQELRTKGIGHKEFKYSEELGCEIPKEWEVVSLGGICKKRHENIIPKGQGMRFVGLEHIESEQVLLEKSSYDYELRSMKSRFYAKDVLYGKLRPYLDKAVIAETEGICSTDILVLAAMEDKIDPYFLVYLIHSKRFLSHAVSSTSGTNYPRTSWKAIGQFVFGRPPISEQHKIAAILINVDEQERKEKKTKVELEKLKKGLMQILLTGQVRIKVD